VSEQTAVYRLYDADEVLLYVGVTKNFEARRQQHKATRPWWPRVKRPVVDLYDDEQEALQVELDAIKREHPVHNVAQTNQHYRSRRETGTARHYMGTSEIRRELGVSRQRVQQLTNSADFPEPSDILAMGKVWKRGDVEVWARGHGRMIAAHGADCD
jgi:predicted GIY-YIG superfamily endonuclease